jgi:hypothetical protein
MLNVSTTGDRYVSQIKFVGDCTQRDRYCFHFRPGGGIFLTGFQPTSKRGPERMLRPCQRTAHHDRGTVDVSNAAAPDAATVPISKGWSAPVKQRIRLRQRLRSKALPLPACEFPAPIADT